MGVAFARWLIGLLLLAALPVCGQASISGQITSSSGGPLSRASVLLKDPSSKIVAYAISGEDGVYSITVKDPGNYTLEANFIGFKKESLTVNVASEKIIQNFILEESGVMLDEVVIEKEQAVKRRGDTLIYDAKALNTGHEKVVEDLLRNIPGITIQKDGTIKYGDVPV